MARRGKIEVKMNSAGCIELLRSEAVASDMLARAERIADRANSQASPDEMDNMPFEAGQGESPGRMYAYVVTATPHGIHHNNKHNTLLKSVDAGR